MFMQIYIPMLYVARMTQNKNDSISSVLQHGHVVGHNVVQYFLLQDSIFDPVSQTVRAEGS